MRQWLYNKIKEHAGQAEFDVLTPPDPEMGDYSTNAAFLLAKREKINPRDAAKELAAKLSSGEVFEKIEVAGAGYINFFLKQEFLQAELKRINGHADHLGRQAIGEGRTVIVEYSSPNIAKPMHIGHLRSTIIGDALANVYEALGYKVVRWNYIGDWGTQFGKLIAAWRKWGDEKKLEENPISTLLELYVAFHKNLEANPALEGEGREEFRKLEDGNGENRKIWWNFREQSLKEFELTYRRLGVHFDLNKGESDYEKELKPIIDWLQKEGKIKESEGALIFDLEKYGLPPMLLQKSDGATLYATRDLASLGDRLKEYKPAKILYVVANQQALHFEQLFSVANELNMNSAELMHVKFGMVLGQDGKKLATREGNAVPLLEVMEKIIALAADTVRRKNPDTPEDEIEKISEIVGIGALKYNDLKQHPHSDIVFDWNAMLDLSGNSGPYLQYTYARLSSILVKSGKPGDADLSLLSGPLEWRLMKSLLDFPDTVERCAHEYALNGLSLYLYELSGLANRYYEEVRILDDENSQRKSARLVLIETVSATLKAGLGLLGIRTLGRI